MMPKTTRKRLVVLALLAFFCCGAVTGVDWHRLGGGFLAPLEGRHEPVVASGGPLPSGADGTVVATREGRAQAAGPRLAPARRRQHAQGTGDAGGDRGRGDDDLFQYGLPAAGGIPAGRFVVAQNEAPAGGHSGPGDAAAPSDAGGPASPGSDVSSPAPGPLPGPSDAGLPGGKGTAPGQPGGSDPGPGDTGSMPAPSPGPVSAVPETSPLAMMGLAALFIAVAASRRRRA